PPRLLCTQAGSPLEPKRRIVGRGVGALLASLALLLGASAPALADIVYLYDDLGRLVRVILPDGNAATYHYDPVGNILQITRETGVSQTTTVDSQSASSGAQGQVVPVTITGTNLSGATVVCTSPGITAQNVRTDSGQMTVELLIAATAPTGPVQCEVRGITNNPIAFSVLTALPAYLTGLPVSVQVGQPLTPSVAGSVSVRLADPPLVADKSVAGTLIVQVGPVSAESTAAAAAVSGPPVMRGGGRGGPTPAGDRVRVPGDGCSRAAGPLRASARRGPRRGHRREFPPEQRTGLEHHGRHLLGQPRRNRGRSPDRHCAERTRRRAGDPDHDRSGLFYSRRHRRQSLHSPIRVAGPNSRGRHAGRRRTMRRLFISGLSVLAAWLAAGGDLAWSQTFNSGSTGSDLAFSPNGSTTVTVPASGV